MLFVQTAAPTGWTKSTTHDNKALRVVSGSVTTGGTQNFTAVLNGTVGATTLTTAQIPSHTHTAGAPSSILSGQTNRFSFAQNNTVAINLTTNATGGGGSHTHSMDVAYVDVIIATKD
jgi:microcystin-dependent protein